MDLSRAKTILIIAFLLLNIFLGVRLWQSPQYLKVRGGVTAEEAEQARVSLQNAGFELQASIPRQTPRLSLLHVTHPAAQAGAWVARFWPQGGEERLSANEGEKRFARGSELLTIAQNGLVTFTGALSSLSAATDDGRAATERFLRERAITDDSLKFDLATTGAEEVYLSRYLYTYQGFPIFNSFVEVQIQSEGLLSINIYRVTPTTFSGKEIQVVSAAEAVDYLIRQAGSFAGKTIVDISLGYYSQAYDAERWEMAPVWRFAASDGSVIFINAFTGEAEPV